MKKTHSTGSVQVGLVLTLILACGLVSAAANMNWVGTAPAVAQVDTFTPGGTIEDGDVFTLTATGENGDMKKAKNYSVCFVNAGFQRRHLLKQKKAL